MARTKAAQFEKHTNTGPNFRTESHKNTLAWMMSLGFISLHMNHFTKVKELPLALPFMTFFFIFYFLHKLRYANCYKLVSTL